MALNSRNKVSPNFNMSSMTDIVFLLLIFFMLTSTLVTTNAFDLVLPKGKGVTVKKQTVAVNIDKDYNYYIDSDPVSPGLLEQNLQSLMAGADEKTIVLRTEKSVPIEKAVFVMQIAYDNQYKIVLATDPR